MIVGLAQQRQHFVHRRRQNLIQFRQRRLNHIQVAQHRRQVIGQFAIQVNLVLVYGPVQARHKGAALVAFAPGLETDIRSDCRAEIERAGVHFFPLAQGQFLNALQKSIKMLANCGVFDLPGAGT